MNKPYPVNGAEEDITYARRIYKYLKNNPSTVKFFKKCMNKRFRKSNKIIDLQND